MKLTSGTPRQAVAVGGGQRLEEPAGPVQATLVQRLVIGVARHRGLPAGRESVEAPESAGLTSGPYPHDRLNRLASQGLV